MKKMKSMNTGTKKMKRKKNLMKKKRKTRHGNGNGNLDWQKSQASLHLSHGNLDWQKNQASLHLTYTYLATPPPFRIGASFLLIIFASLAIDWFGHTETYCQTNKQTDNVQSSTGRLLNSRPLEADKEPPRAGKLQLPGPASEEVSPSWTSKPPTAHSTSKTSAMGYSVSKAVTRDSDGNKAFVRDSDGNKAFAMDYSVSKASTMGYSVSKAAARDSDRNKAFAMDSKGSKATSLHLRYQLNVFLPQLPEIRCQIQNPWGKVMEKSGLIFEHFCLQVV